MMNNMFMLNVNEVAEMLKVSKAQAYKVIRIFNNELKEQGYFTVTGKVPRAYLEKRIYGGPLFDGI